MQIMAHHPAVSDNHDERFYEYTRNAGGRRWQRILADQLKASCGERIFDDMSALPPDPFADLEPA
jgi:hypothetical protein